MSIDFETLQRAVTPVVVPASADPVNGEPEENPFRGDWDASGNPTPPVPSLPPIVDSATFSVTPLPEPAEIIKGILHQGTKIVIGGGSKSFKTWIQLDCALSIAYGLSWLGHETVAGRVLFVNFEIQAAFFQRRVNKLCEAKGIQQITERLDIWNLRGHCAPYRLIIPQIVERIKSVGYTAVFLDPVYKLYGNTDENSASEVAQLLNSFEHLAVETNSAVAFGAHYSKGNQSGKESIDRISGSGVFARDPDSIIPFTKHEEEGCFVVEPVLRNLPPVEPFVVRWKYPLMRRDDDLDPSLLKQPAHVGKKKQHDPIAVLKFITGRTKDNPISVSEWSELSNIRRQTLQDYISELRNAGLVATSGEGSHARKYLTEKGVQFLSDSTAGN